MGGWTPLADVVSHSVFTWSEVGRYLAFVGGLVAIFLAVIVTICILFNYDWDRLKLGPVCPRCGKRYRQDYFDEVA
jgi:hypothetical protein